MLADELLQGQPQPDEPPLEGAPHDELGASPELRPRTRGQRRAASGRMVAAFAVAAALVAVVGVVVAPVAVLVAAGVVLAAAVFWKSGSSRSAGSSVVPRPAVWAAVVALLLALGAVSLEGVTGSWDAALAGSAAHDRVAAAQVTTPAEGATTPLSAASAGSTPQPSGAVTTPGESEQPAATGQPEVPAPAGPAAAPAAPAVQSAVAPAPAAPTSPTATPSYKNCGALRAAGIQTLLRGQPGYSPRLDRNGDGIACN